MDMYVDLHNQVGDIMSNTEPSFCAFFRKTRKLNIIVYQQLIYIFYRLRVQLFDSSLP